MEDYVQFSAKTKSEAITKACIELGASSDQLEIKVVSEGSSGFFGFGSKPAIIRVKKIETASDEDEIREIVDNVKTSSIKEDEMRRRAPRSPRKSNFKQEERAEKPKKTEPVKAAAEKEEKDPKEAKEAAEPVVKENRERQPRPAKDRPRRERPAKDKNAQAPKEKQAAKAEAPVKEKPVKAAKPVDVLKDPEEIKEVEGRADVFLRDVFGAMGIQEVQIKSTYNTTDGCLEVDFEGDDMGILIGKRGQTLDSLQYLTSLVVNKGKSNYIRVKLDTEDYRRRRKETLENLARGIAYKVKKTHKPVVLEPMNPYERRIIHASLQGNKFVETVSEGEEPYRHVVVKAKK